MTPLRFFTRAIMALLFAVLLTTCPQPQTQQQTGEREYKGFWYKVTLMGGIEITNYTGSEMDISIPEQIENRPVFVIRGRGLRIYDPDTMTTTQTDGAFENKNLTSVILPDTVLYIYSGAFANNNLTGIILPDNLIQFGPYAFGNNRIAGKIIIPDSVNPRIKYQTFEGNQIGGVTIGSGVERIEYAAFRNNKITSLTVPANVTHIEDYAFASNEIAELNLVEGLTIIYPYAFEDNRLTSLSIPAGVGIGYGAFKDNTITRISIGENVRLYSNESQPVFELGFDQFYFENEEQAGNYVYENGEWEFLGGG